MKVTLKNISGGDKYIQNKLNYIKIAVGETIEREIADLNSVPEGWAVVNPQAPTSVIETPTQPETPVVNKKGRKTITESIQTPVVDANLTTSASALGKI